MASTGFAFLGLARQSGPELAAVAGTGLGIGPTGAPVLVSNDEAVRQAVLMLLSTRPGERLMRPDYGCQINRLMFAPNDATTAGLAIHYVRQALLRFEPRIDILRIDAGPATGQEGSGAVLLIVLEYRVRETLRTDHLDLTVDLQGGPA